MALGFGFNKQKILAQAEKFVQQGKLQNAIAEYEKVVKEDPKDLTVLGLIGDFHARVGANDKASYYFKRVGDIYATEGFTVKAIAVYKKITKLNPNNTECITRLAELYTQQGLYNDARQQYVAVADQRMKANQLEDAARIFQKILELDSENTAMQSKLADLYIKLGRKEDARNIFLTAAQSLYNRGALDAADEALKKVISLDPHNQEAALLRGRIASDSGDSTTAIASLNKVPDLDSRPEALRSLMIAHLQAGKYDEAEPLARKLLGVHNDPSGLATLADTLMKAGEVESALKIYNEYSDRFLASGAAALVETLAGSISRIKENAPALELARGILVKANAHAHINEVSELLAHAWVQSGELQKASEIYKELSLLEPENPLHLQNYKQIQGKLGKDPTVREMSKEDGAQALMVDELELESPPLETHYLDSVNEAVKAAVTEAELFESYNMPHKALGPLESALQKAPRDSQLNQKLAVLYARSGRMEEAIRCCTVLRDIYTEAGHDREARRFGEMAEKYRGRSKAASAAASVEFDASFMPGEEIHTPPPTSASAATADTSALSGAGIPPSPASSPATSTGSVAEFNITPEIAASAQPAPGNIAEFAIDVASGHSQAISQSALEQASQTGASASAPPPSAREIDLSEWESMTSVEEPAPPAAAQADTGPLIEEIRFFLSQSMWEESRSGIAKLESQAPAAPEIADLRQQLQAGLAAAERAKAEAAAEKARAAAAEQKAKAEAAAAEKAKAAAAKAAPKKEKAEEPPAKVAAQPAAVTPEDVKPAASKIPPAKAPAAKPAAKKTTGLSDFVLDLDESLGEDFAFGGKPAASAPPPSAPAAASSPSMSAAPSKAEPSSFRPPAQAGAASFANPEASSALSDMFAEFKEDVEEGSDDAEDPDTHYNLGVAFKEMGLLDEAIGELQKVCKAIDRGAPFTQVMQAYTWLAHCFLEKGTPEASVKWYERALKYASGDEESKLAVYYELGSAHEAAGNKKAALANFMEVYGSNIDYRDVADRIKVLKSQESVAVSGGDGPRA